QPLFTGVNGRILVFGQDNGTDVIQINKSIKAQTLLVGGTGNDTITGGGGVNFVSGGLGDNTLNGGASGKNTLFESEDSSMILQSGTTKTNGSLTSDGIDDVLVKNTFKNAQFTTGPTGNTLDASHFVGNTVLVGSSGNDNLIGGSGFNVLIGGVGGDTLQGGKNSDLLIGGTTAFDANVTALSAILAEWSSTTAYATKIAHLLGTKFGGLNGSILLNPATVSDDGAANNLTGGAGLDWFFQGSADIVNDLNAGLKKPTEIVTSLS
ncbi:MAG TPA: calcium-binding protein, partial [Chthoniobacteraceae bacterium]